MKKNKYVLVTVSGVHIAIGIPDDEIAGYTTSVIETVFPDGEGMERWSKKESKAWQKENNRRMEIVLNALNKEL